MLLRTLVQNSDCHPQPTLYSLDTVPAATLQTASDSLKALSFLLHHTCTSQSTTTSKNSICKSTISRIAIKPYPQNHGLGHLPSVLQLLFVVILNPYFFFLSRICPLSIFQLHLNNIPIRLSNFLATKNVNAVKNDWLCICNHLTHSSNAASAIVEIVAIGIDFSHL